MDALLVNFNPQTTFKNACESQSTPNNEMTPEEEQSLSESNSAPQTSLKILQPPRTKWWPILVMSMVAITTGTAVSFVGVVLPQLTQAGSDQLSLTNEEASILVSLLFVGQMIGACLSWPLQTIVGQRIVIIMGLCLNAASWFVIALTTSIWFLYLARLAQGMCISALVPSVITYLVETTHKTSRGWQSGMSYVCRSTGLLVPAITTTANLSWHQTGIVCGILNLLPIIFTLLLPDSPRWLMTRGRNSDAKRSLTFFRGNSYEAESEYNEIVCQAAKEGQGGICHQMSILLKAPTRHTVGLLIVISVMMYFGGSHLIIAYMVPLLQLTNISIDPFQISIVCFLTRILGSILSVCLTHCVGRKPFIIVGLTASSLCFGIISLFFFLQKLEVSGISWMAIVAIIIVMFSDGISFTGYETLQAELLPLSCRTIGILLVFCTGGITGVVILIVHEKMTVILGMDATFLLYTAVAAIIPLVISLCLKETHDIPLEKLSMDIIP